MTVVRGALDSACAEAVELARAAAVARSGVFGVGDHLGVTAEGTRLATHEFACDHPGYRGWRWSVTVVRAARARHVTVNEVLLVPGPESLVAPSWVPWQDRIGPGDLTPGLVMPTSDEDPRLEPGYTGGELAADTDPAEWAQTRAVAAELGLGRERVLSAAGRDEAVERWLESEGGPDNEMTHAAPANCHTCGYFIAISGALGRLFGVCANQYSPSDGHVVSRNHGCGGHSDIVPLATPDRTAKPAWDTVSSDDLLFS